MSAKATFWAWVQRDTEGNRKLVLLAYANYANHNDEAWPSKETVARITGLSKATVKRCVLDLCEMGKMKPIKRRVTGETGDGKDRETVVYKMACSGVKVNPVQDEPGSNGDQVGSGSSPTGVTVSPNPKREPINKPTMLRRTQITTEFLMPDEWGMSAYRYWAENGCNDLDALQEFEKFKAHHISKGSRMDDWAAAWRTWYIRAAEFTQRAATR